MKILKLPRFLYKNILNLSKIKGIRLLPSNLRLCCYQQKLMQFLRKEAAKKYGYVITAVM